MRNFTRDIFLQLCAVCFLGLAFSSSAQARGVLQCDVGEVSLPESGTAEAIEEAVIATRKIAHGCTDTELVFNVMLAQREVENSILEDLAEASNSQKKKKPAKKCTSFEKHLAIAQALVPSFAEAASTAIAKANKQATEGDKFQQQTENIEAKLKGALDAAAKPDTSEDQSDRVQQEMLSLAFATAIARLVSEAPCIGGAPPKPDNLTLEEVEVEIESTLEDLCSCSEDGVSNGVDTGEPGCVSDHTGKFCYIKGNADTCKGAEASNKHKGAFWTDCN
ncbi:hypothetical protein BSKO_13367 [Bryopsis sp. KO-2023]|nr:hypothetical protein BSKO_13367 [Bryopsis sp. KO-2023]